MKIKTKSVMYNTKTAIARSSHTHTHTSPCSVDKEKLLASYRACVHHVLDMMYIDSK